MYWNANTNLLIKHTDMLNSNIRCIEIKVYTLLKVCAAKLNSNIRCIEMVISIKHMIKDVSWIVTLDVLKFSDCTLKKKVAFVE